jgi:curved DNA-binding protein CbpA
MTNSAGTTGDHYRLLGISPDATRAEIRAAYRGKVRLFHPDLVAGKTEDARQAATEMTAQLNNAYECLSNPSRRAAYDTSNRADTASASRASTVLLVVSPRTLRCEVTPGDTVHLTLGVEADHPPGGDGLQIRTDRSMAAALTVTTLTACKASLEVRIDTSKLEAHRIYHIPIVVTWGG